MSYAAPLPARGTFAAWRAAARRAISHRIAPDEIDWAGGGGLFAAAPLPAAGDGGPGRPRALGRLRAAHALAEAPER